MTSLFIRDTPKGFEIVITDEYGQKGEPLPLTNKGLLDLDCNISQFKRLAWQRIKQTI